MCEDERAFLGGELVLLLPGLLQQLLPHHGEHRAQQRPAEDLRGLVAGQAVAELRHIAIAEPSANRTKHSFCFKINKIKKLKSRLQERSVLPRVVGFVPSCVIIGHPLASLRGRFQLPVVDLVQKHLSQLHDGLTFF